MVASPAGAAADSARDIQRRTTRGKPLGGVFFELSKMGNKRHSETILLVWQIPGGVDRGFSC
ncbi:MAG: hypothetical protein A2341_20680 [Deltaproteobacteria bacterium RIFOXYB12_FULL_58_9]|nr:MAG: hypothetical protein A2341_20680 [Deltaproteobacteria bacterium RIFOXYB12_FULL_58_9]